VFTRSSKRPALARVFWIHLLEFCWTFARSCKHLITGYLCKQAYYAWPTEMQNDTGKYYELSSFDIQLLFRLIRKHVKCKIMSRGCDRAERS